MFCPTEVDGKDSMLLPNWPRCLRVKITTAAPITMDEMMEQQCLNLKGFSLPDGYWQSGPHASARTESKYYLAAAVAMRSSPQGSDVVVTGSEAGMQTCPLAEDPKLGLAAHQEPDEDHIVVKAGMLYFVLSPPRDDTDDVSMSPPYDDPDELDELVDIDNMSISFATSSTDEAEDEPQLIDYRKFRARLKKFDRSPPIGLTPLSHKAEEGLREDIASGYEWVEKTFFG